MDTHYYCYCTCLIVKHIIRHEQLLLPFVWCSVIRSICQFTIYISCYIDSTICEDYRCSPDKQTCTHTYKVCEVKDNVEPYCSASYIVNAGNKLELKVKGCENEPLLHDCYNNTECHIDNQLNDAENQFYVCCCDESYCNQNISYTHPTEHSQYGESGREEGVDWQLLRFM